MDCVRGFLHVPMLCESLELGARGGAGMISLFVVVTNIWTFGKYLERVTVWPAAAVLALYIVCGLVGAGVASNLSVNSISAGAPAAVCGLLGPPLLLCTCAI